MSTTSTTPAAMASRGDDSEWWTLGVKTVGAELISPDGDMIPSSFQIRVQPSADISILQDRIQDLTGLKHQQQRLIYRGRIIQNEAQHSFSSETNNGPSFTKIREIKGLSDGQTIHLVKRQATTASEGTSSTPQTSAESNSNSNNNADNANDTSTSTSVSPSASSSSSPSTSLLAALLGMSAMDEEAEGSNENSGSTPSPSSRRYGSRRSRNHYRLTAEDVQVPDPGSMETVRQGLMTLHTLLPTAETARQNSAQAPSTSQSSNSNSATSATSRPPLNPLAHNRSWYIGQWIDCRDTVNQWLEATITDIVRPDEILPADRPPLDADSTSTPTIPALDPAVGTTDLNGRRRLLLEPTDEENDPFDLGGELAGYRERRTNNAETVLLHVHYNGWPHRWDEWIRSDSERIRPFRVRTRHGSSSSSSQNSNNVAPNIQSVYADSPETYMGGRNDAEDRTFLLHELARVTGAVHELAQRAAAALPLPETERTSEHLPWISTRPDSESNSTTEQSNLEWNIDAPARNTSQQRASIGREGGYSNQELQSLAPLLDRLGRTLVDAAPHVASLAASDPIEIQHEPTPQTTEHTESENREDAEDSGTAESNIVESSEESSDSSGSPNPTTLNGLLSMLNRERDRNAQANGSDAIENSIDPDYTDFATGFVNVSRGDVRSGPRSRSSRDELSTLLGAYLAAASLGLGSAGGSDGNAGSDEGNGDLGGLGRLLQSRGNGDGGGIDIHIHAVVTGPGMPPSGLSTGAGGSNNDADGAETPTGLGALGLGLGGGTTPSSDLFANTRRATAQRVRATLLEQNNEEDRGIFDDLYSENPDPIDPSSSSAANNANDNNRLRRSSAGPQEGTASTTDEASSTGSSRRRSRSQRQSTSSSNGNRGSFFSRMFRRGTD